MNINKMAEEIMANTKKYNIGTLAEAAIAECGCDECVAKRSGLVKDSDGIHDEVNMWEPNEEPSSPEYDEDDVNEDPQYSAIKKQFYDAEKLYNSRDKKKLISYESDRNGISINYQLELIHNMIEQQVYSIGETPIPHRDSIVSLLQIFRCPKELALWLDGEGKKYPDLLLFYNKFLEIKDAVINYVETHKE